MHAQSLSRIWFFATLWTVAHEGLVHGISRQEYWSTLPFPPLGDLPDPGIEPTVSWISLMVQWIRIGLSMQGTPIWSLVQKDCTCLGATKPRGPSYWADALDPRSRNYQAHGLQLLKLSLLEPSTREATAMRSLCTTTKSSPCSLPLEKAHVQQWRPSTAKK